MCDRVEKGKVQRSGTWSGSVLRAKRGRGGGEKLGERGRERGREKERGEDRQGEGENILVHRVPHV